MSPTPAAVPDPKPLRSVDPAASALSRCSRLIEALPVGEATFVLDMLVARNDARMDARSVERNLAAKDAIAR